MLRAEGAETGGESCSSQRSGKLGSLRGGNCDQDVTTLLLWFERVCPPYSHLEILAPGVMVLGGEPLGGDGIMTVEPPQVGSVPSRETHRAPGPPAT